MRNLRLTRQGNTQWILWDGPEMLAYVLDTGTGVVVNMIPSEDEIEELEEDDAL